MESPDHSLIQISGLVIPADWDERGNVTALSISSFDEDQYLIVKDKKGDQLYPFMGKKVEVLGIIKESGKIKRIKIKDYHIE